VNKAEDYVSVPGPGTYESSFFVNKNDPQYSFRPKSYKEADLKNPGPGFK
jgi:hypothetical protein